MADWSHYMGVICVCDVRVLALLLLEAQYHRAGGGYQQQCRVHHDAATPRSGASDGRCRRRREGARLSGRVDRSAPAGALLCDEEHHEETEGSERGSPRDDRWRVVGFAGDAPVRDITDDERGGAYERTAHHRPLAGSKDRMNAGNRARISWSQTSEHCHRHGEPVVPRRNARPENAAAD